MTPFMNTTDKCLLFFYKRRTDNVTIQFSVTSEHLEDILSEELYLPYESDLVKDQWMPYFSILPTGIHHISLTVVGKGQIESFIDDFSIRPCYDYSTYKLLHQISNSFNSVFGSLK